MLPERLRASGPTCFSKNGDESHMVASQWLTFALFNDLLPPSIGLDYRGPRFEINLFFPLQCAVNCCIEITKTPIIFTHHSLSNDALAE